MTISILAAWLVCGIIGWIAAITRYRVGVTVGDLLMLPVCAVFGLGTLILLTAHMVGEWPALRIVVFPQRPRAPQHQGEAE